MIDPTTEDVLSLSEAAAHVEALYGGGRPSRTTLWRWCSKGRSGIRLDYLRRGPRRIVTSREALHRFFCALTEQDLAAAAACPDRTAAVDAANEELGRHGI